MVSVFFTKGPLRRPACYKRFKRLNERRYNRLENAEPQKAQHDEQRQHVDSLEIQQLAEEFASCRKILLALGDENRQHLIVETIEIGKCDGVRMGEITERTHLSRPAVSHHLQILKGAGLVKMRRESTKNYYYFDANAKAMNGLLHMLMHAKRIMEDQPDRSCIKQHGRAGTKSSDSTLLTCGYAVPKIRSHSVRRGGHRTP